MMTKYIFLFLLTAFLSSCNQVEYITIVELKEKARQELSLYNSYNTHYQKLAYNFAGLSKQMHSYISQVEDPKTQPHITIKTLFQDLKTNFEKLGNSLTESTRIKAKIETILASIPDKVILQDPNLETLKQLKKSYIQLIYEIKKTEVTCLELNEEIQTLFANHNLYKLEESLSNKIKNLGPALSDMMKTAHTTLRQLKWEIQRNMNQDLFSTKDYSQMKVLLSLQLLLEKIDYKKKELDEISSRFFEHIQNVKEVWLGPGLIFNPNFSLLNQKINEVKNLTNEFNLEKSKIHNFNWEGFNI